jgi:acetyl esterase
MSSFVRMVDKGRRRLGLARAVAASCRRKIWHGEEAMAGAGQNTMMPDESVERLFESRRGRPPVDWENLTVETARANFAAAQSLFPLPPPDLADVSDVQAHWEGQAVSLRIYRPAISDIPQPAMIFFHGGGWVLGDLDSHDHLCRMLASLSGVVVLSVDYPLSPENRFPGAVASSLAAVRWIFAQAEQLGLDSRRVAVGGDSAGGNLAAVMALHSRKGALPPFRAQLLFYPLLDLTASGPSYRNAHPDLSIPASAISWYVDHYLGTTADPAQWEASPLLASDLDESCPAFILTAGCDVVCSDGTAYAERLRQAGVAVIEKHYPGQVHAFLSLPHLLPEAVDAFQVIANYLAHNVSAPVAVS